MKKYYCKCGKEISTKETKRCLRCYHKWAVENGIRKGIKNGAYKHGETCNNRCIDCKKKISYGSDRCLICELKRKHKLGIISSYTSNLKHGNNKTNKKYKVCGKHIRPQSIVCQTCSGIIRRGKSINKGRNNGMFGKPTPHGKGSYYKNIWMRSSYEIAYAKWLDKKKTKWIYESKTFDLGEMNYTPDFYLPENDTYIEIKGYWRTGALLRFKLFKQKFPNLKIKIMNKNKLKYLGIIK